MADQTLSGSSVAVSAGTVAPQIYPPLLGSVVAASTGAITPFNTHVLAVDLPTEVPLRIDLTGISQTLLFSVADPVVPVNTVTVPTGLRQTHILAVATSTAQMDIPVMSVSQGVALQVTTVSPATVIDPLAITTWPLLVLPDLVLPSSIVAAGIVQTHMLAVPASTLQTTIPEIVMYLPDICPSPSSSLEQVDQVQQWSSDTGYPDQVLRATSQSFRLTLIWEQIELMHKGWIEGFCRGNAQNEFLYTYIYDGWTYNCVIEEFPKVSHDTASQRVDVTLVLRGYRVP